MSEKKSNYGLVNISDTKVHVLGEKSDKAVADFIGKALGPVAGETGDLLGDLAGCLADRVSAFRWKNRLSTFQRAREKLIARGIDPNDAEPIPEGQVYSILEGVSDVEEPELQDLWAGLLANAMDPESETDANRSLPGILNQLSAEDAKLLNLLCQIEMEVQELEDRKKPLSRQLSESMRKSKDRMPDAKIGEEIRALDQAARERIRQHITNSGLKEKLRDPKISHNLFRLGLLRNKVVSRGFGGMYLDDRELGRATKGNLESLMQAIEKLHRQQVSATPPDQMVIKGTEKMFYVNIGLTEFGERFLRACGAFEQAAQQE